VSAGGLDDAERLQVVGGEDRGRRVVQGEEFQGGPVGGFEAEVALFDEPGVGRDAGAGERGLV